MLDPLVIGAAVPPVAAPAVSAQEIACSIRLTITSPLHFRNVPMDPTIDFGTKIREAGLRGRLDPNSIEVLNPATGHSVPHALPGDFAYGDKRRVEWVICDPAHIHYEIRFRVVAKRPPVLPRENTPLIGVGDLLRYNAGRQRPITLLYSSGLHDLIGDGRPDLVGCWNYAYRPGVPWDGIICYPRVGPQNTFEFGDLIRVRYAEGPDTSEFKHFQHTNMAVDFTDLDRDGDIDLVYTRRGRKSAEFFLNSRQRDAGGMPIFTSAGSVTVNGWDACRAVDLNGDGAIDLVVSGEYLRNTNPQGWPFEPAQPVKLNAGRQPCFLDLDWDGRLDTVCLQRAETTHPNGYRIAWRHNLGGDTPEFGAQ